MGYFMADIEASGQALRAREMTHFRAEIIKEDWI